MSDAIPEGLRGGRSVFVDNLRAAVVLCLVPFHTARIFDVETWHIKDAARSVAADAIVGSFNAFAMPTLFLAAGFAAWGSLASRTLPGFVRERAARLMVPLAIGIVVFVLPQVYWERIAPASPATMSPQRTSEGFLAFVPQFFDCCYPAANFSYHHLWFLLYLFVTAVVLAPVLLAMRRWPAAGPLARLRGAAARRALVLLALPPVVAEVLLRPHFPSTHALVDDWANHAHFGLAFLAGAVLAASPATAARLARWGPSLLWVGAHLLAIALVNALVWRFLDGTAWIVFRTVTECLLVGGLFGTFRRYLDRQTPVLTRFAPLAMPFYLVHQTVIVGLAFLLLGWQAGVPAKFAVIAAVAMISSLAFAAGVARVPALRWMVGLPRLRCAGPGAPRETAPGAAVRGALCGGAGSP